MYKTEFDQRVVDWCASHKLCKGCPIHCVAPVSDRDFLAWVERQEKLIISHVEKLAKPSAD